ncbi:MAG: endonuclease VII domain-containing protein [Actinomycetota bacterium]
MRCPDCGRDKPVDEFSRNRSSRSGRATYCKQCANRRNRATIKRLYGDTRHYHFTSKYGIGLAEVEAMKTAQDELCAICRTNPATQVDHDHKTRTVRGLLCDGCNGGLGLFGDDIQSMQRAIKYLEKHV